MSGRTVDEVNLPERMGRMGVENSGFHQGLKQSDNVGPPHQLRIGMGMEQDQILHDEFDVDDAAGALFEIKPSRPMLQQFASHSGPHGQNFFPQTIFCPGSGQHLSADVFKPPGQEAVSGNGSCLDQGLVLPGPCLFFLIILKR